MIREFITELLEMKGERTDVSDTEQSLTAGLLDSLDVMSIVVFLEDNFGLDFSVHRFIPDNFERVESILRMVK